MPLRDDAGFLIRRDAFTDEQIEMYLSRVKCALRRHNAEEAKHMIDLLFAEPPRQTLTLDSPLSLLDINVRTVNMLEADGLVTIGQVVNVSDARLGMIANIAHKSITQLRFAIKQALAPAEVHFDWSI